jgi:hypothetical protein
MMPLEVLHSDALMHSGLGDCTFPVKWYHPFNKYPNSTAAVNTCLHDVQIMYP